MRSTGLATNAGGVLPALCVPLCVSLLSAASATLSAQAKPQSKATPLELTHLRTRASRAAHAGPRSPPSTRAPASRGQARTPRPSAGAAPVI
jgi:hypothetical protein